ncbi:uncharacterized protein LOC134455720 [Engraulis encrasicolus]|uniref:uncharacterized protein LOC134455720 n=1 Tax=Engraulis encrasicolus TaxID=184585 RepID=UPI002FD5B5A6
MAQAVHLNIEGSQASHDKGTDVPLQHAETNQHTETKTDTKTETEPAELDVPSWLPEFFRVVRRDKDYISGVVQTQEDAGRLVETLSRATSTSFVTWSEHKKEAGKVRFVWQVEDYDEGTPLCVTKRMAYTCQHAKASQTKPKEERPDIKRRRRRKGKKWDCPAKLFIRYVTRYDTFAVKGNGPRSRKEEAMKNLKKALLSDSPPPTSTFIHLKIPLLGAHNHTNGPTNGNTQEEPPLSRTRRPPRARKKMRKTVAQGMGDGGGGGEAEDVGREEEYGGEMEGEDDNAGEERIHNEGKERALERGQLGIKSAQHNMREALRKLADATHLCNDSKTLQRMTVALDNMRRALEHQSHNGNGRLPNTAAPDKVMHSWKDLRTQPVSKSKSRTPRKRKGSQDHPLTPSLNSSPVLRPNS